MRLPNKVQEMRGEKPRFIADNMLGGLARWLRILGYDTVYERNMPDWMVLQRAELEDRIILTRDRALHRRALKKGLSSVFIWGIEVDEMLAQLASSTGIELSVDFSETRCPEDNAQLVKVDKDKIKDKVPRRVYELHDDFWLCPRCGKAYWVGNHWKKIEEVLEDARLKLRDLNKFIRGESNGGRSSEGTNARGGGVPRKDSEDGRRGVREEQEEG